MKIVGVVLCVFAVLIFIVMLIANLSDAPSDAVTRKLSAAILLGLIGSVLNYYGNKKTSNIKTHYETE